MSRPAIRFYDARPPAEFREEILDGLGRAQKSLPPKFFYDARGSRLFEAICELPEYYLTRTEIALLRTYAEEIARFIDPGGVLLDLGSGSSRKVRLLIEAFQPKAYMPLDISRDHLLSSARALASDYPGLEVHATCLDYAQGLRLPYRPPDSKVVVFFPGSSIGNFEPEQARRLLRGIGRLLGNGGCLLIGVDLKKEAGMLKRAYNDSRGVTAAFNLNLLRRINRELDGDFALDRFRHRAFYNESAGRIEMHLVSAGQQRVELAGQCFHFAAGESIHTENSYKYTIEGFRTLAAGAGLGLVRAWTDPAGLFSVQLYARQDALSRRRPAAE